MHIRKSYNYHIKPDFNRYIKFLFKIHLSLKVSLKEKQMDKAKAVEGGAWMTKIWKMLKAKEFTKMTNRDPPPFSNTKHNQFP